MLFFLLAMLAPSQAEPPVVSIIGPASPPPTEAQRRYPIGPPAADWPSARHGAILASPDWSDERIYPVGSDLRGEQGLVRIALRIEADGRPSACRVTQATGFVELDDATCDLAMTMRFAPVGDPPVATRYISGVDWEAGNSIALAPLRAVLHLELSGGRIASCRIEDGRDVPYQWLTGLCMTFIHEPDEALRADLTQARARRASVVVLLSAEGDARAAPPPPHGRLVRATRTGFELTAAGHLAHCRTDAADGAGSADGAAWGPCGPALAPLLFKPLAGPSAPHRGTVEIGVYAEF